MSTQNLKFIHLSTGSASTHKADTGAIIFEKASGRIAVANGSDKIEYYGGGRVSDATFKDSILTISFNDSEETIKLDFSDVASTSGVNKILGKLRTDVDALSGRVTTLEGTVATNTTDIAAIKDESTGILADAKKYADGLAKNYDAAGAAAKALEDAKAYTDGKIGNIGDKTVEAYVTDKVSEINSVAGGLDGRVTTLEGKVDNLKTTVGDSNSGLVKDVVDNAKAIADNAKAIAAINDESTGILAQAKSYTDTAKEAANKYTDGKVSDINATTAGLRSDVDTLKATVGDASNGLVKDVADNTDKLNTLIGSDAGKSARTIVNEELAAQLIPEGAKESLDTLQEIAAWIQAHPDDASAMNGKIAALEGTVGNASSGLVKDVADNKSAINVNAGAIDALKKLHVDGKTVAQEVTDGIAGIPEASKSAGTDVVVTVKTKSGSVSAVEVNADVLAGKVTANTNAITAEVTRAKGEEEGLRNDVNANAAAIKVLQDAQASGSLMWSVWD